MPHTHLASCRPLKCCKHAARETELENAAYAVNGPQAHATQGRSPVCWKYHKRGHVQQNCPELQQTPTPADSVKLAVEYVSDDEGAWLAIDDSDGSNDKMPGLEPTSDSEC